MHNARGFDFSQMLSQKICFNLLRFTWIIKITLYITCEVLVTPSIENENLYLYGFSRKFVMVDLKDRLE